MNLSDFSVDWNSVEDISFEVLPKGDYAAKVIKSEFKKTKKGDDMLAMQFEILGTGKKVFENYMFTCAANPATVGFALSKIKALATVLDLDFDNMDDTSEFHGKAIGVKVKVNPAKGDYGESNAIAGFFEYSEDLLEVGSSDSAIEVDEVEVEEELVVEDESLESKPTPEAIKAMKKDELVALAQSLSLDITGKKVSEVEDVVIEALYGVEEIEDEDIILD